MDKIIDMTTGRQEITLPADFEGEILQTDDNGLLRVIRFFKDRQPNVRWYSDRETYDEHKAAAKESSDKFWNAVMWDKK